MHILVFGVHHRVSFIFTQVNIVLFDLQRVIVLISLLCSGSLGSALLGVFMFDFVMEKIKVKICNLSL